ncbi:MAG: helix-turn-helix domain-containing protein [Limisphaerales bacterium]
MSNSLLTAAWKVAELVPGTKLTAPQKLVLVRLADRADDNGRCFPGVSSIAQECCLCERAVRSALKDLSAAGHITVAQAHGRTASGFARNTYTVHPLTPAPDAAVTPAPGAAVNQADTGTSFHDTGTSSHDTGTRCRLTIKGVLLRSEAEPATTPLVEQARGEED